MQLMSAAMSSARQTVMCDPSLIPAGKRPDLMPCHHVERPTGMNFRTAVRRRNPVEGSERGVSCDM